MVAGQGLWFRAWFGTRLNGEVCAAMPGFLSGLFWYELVWLILCSCSCTCKYYVSADVLKRLKSILCTNVFLDVHFHHSAYLYTATLDTFLLCIYFLTYIKFKFLSLTCIIGLKICDSVLLSERDCSVHGIKTQQWICLLWYWWRYWFSFQGENLWRLYSIYFQLIVIFFCYFLSNHFSVVHACQFRKLPLFGIIMRKNKI